MCQCLVSQPPGKSVGQFIDAHFLMLQCLRFICPEQEEMCRIEEEQSFEELKILRELVHDRFYKQEELAEVRNPFRKGLLVPEQPYPFIVNMPVPCQDT